MTRKRKTKKMLAVEEKFGQPLEEMLPELIDDQWLTKSDIADEIDVSKATLDYWLGKLGINVIRVALKPGETFDFETKRVITRA